jgi:hypothetical protein
MKKLQWTKRRVNPRQLSARIPPHGGYIITEAPGVVDGWNAYFVKENETFDPDSCEWLGLGYDQPEAKWFAKQHAERFERKA